MTREYYGTKRITGWEEMGGENNVEPGYGVMYKGGYQSWSPKEVFEKTYQPLDALSFGHALVALQEGKRVTRAGWNGEDMYLELQVPDEHSKMQKPYIYINPGEGWMIPWVASQPDMLANDWRIV